MKKLLSLFVLLIAATCFYAEGNHKGEYIYFYQKDNLNWLLFLNHIDSITFEKPTGMTIHNSNLEYSNIDTTKECMYTTINNDSSRPYRVTLLSNIDSIEFSNRPLDFYSVLQDSFDVANIDSIKQKLSKIDNYYSSLWNYNISGYNTHLFQQYNYFFLIPSDKVWQKEYKSYLKYSKYFNGNAEKYYFYILNHVTFDNYSKEYYLRSYNTDSIASNSVLWSIQPGQTFNIDSIISIGGTRFYSNEANELLKGAKNLNFRYQNVWTTDTLRIKNLYEPFKIYDLANDSLYANELLHSFKYLNGTINDIIDQAFNPMGGHLSVFNANTSKYYIKWLGDGGRSNWTFFIPTDSAWAKAYRLNKEYKYLRYDSTSIRLLIEPTLFYCNDKVSNKELNNIEEGQSVKTDSLLTYSGNKISRDEVNNMLNKSKKISLGNFTAWIMDTIAYNPWEKMNEMNAKPERIIIKPAKAFVKTFRGDTTIARYNYEFPSIDRSSDIMDTLTTKNRNLNIKGDVLNDTYLTIHPYSSAVNPEVDIDISNFLSSTYDIYCVTVPRSINMDNKEDTLPNKIKMTLLYEDLNEKWKTVSFGTFETNPNKVDTIHVGTFTFPARESLSRTYSDRTNNIAQTTLELKSSVRFIDNKKFSRTLAIDHIFLVPKEDANESKSR